jgi:hypothetical protein
MNQNIKLYKEYKKKNCIDQSTNRNLILDILVACSRHKINMVTPNDSEVPVPYGTSTAFILQQGKTKRILMKENKSMSQIMLLGTGYLLTSKFRRRFTYLCYGVRIPETQLGFDSLHVRTVIRYTLIFRRKDYLQTGNNHK